MTSELKVFGTDGVRGKVGEHPMTVDFVSRLAGAAASVLAPQGGTVVVGKDTRISGYMFESALEAALVDSGAGTAAHKVAAGSPCVTISLELKFISMIKLGQELVGKAKIQKKTKSMVFLTCELTVANKIVATASGVWKILKKLPRAGPDG